MPLAVGLVALSEEAGDKVGDAPMLEEGDRNNGPEDAASDIYPPGKYGEHP